MNKNYAKYLSLFFIRKVFGKFENFVRREFEIRNNSVVL